MVERDLQLPPITKGGSFNMAVDKKYATKNMSPPALAMVKHNSNMTSDEDHGQGYEDSLSPDEIRRRNLQNQRSPLSQIEQNTGDTQDQIATEATGDQQKKDDFV